MMVSSTRLRSTHCRLRAFAVDNGVDGAFRLSQETAFSRRFPGREHAIRLLDAVTGADVHAVDAESEKRRQARQRQPGDSRLNSEAL